MAQIRVENLRRGANFEHQLTGPVDQDQTHTQIGVAADANADTNEQYTPPALDLVILDIAPLRDSDALLPGYYWGISVSEMDAAFNGSVLFESTDDILFEQVDDAARQVSYGESLTVLATGIVGAWDEVNTVDIELINGALESRTTSEVLEGRNRAILNGEIIGFRTVTALGDDEYTLSGLLRGLRDTIKLTGTHQIGDSFVVLDNALEFREMNIAGRGSTRYVKGVADGGAESDVDSESFSWLANTLTPFAPGNLVAIRDGSNDIAFSWVRRSRSIVQLFGPGPIPNNETIERYQITLSNVSTPADPNIVVTIDDAMLTTITAAQRTAVGWAAGDTVKLTIAQVSAIVGPGNTSDINA